MKTKLLILISFLVLGISCSMFIDHSKQYDGIYSATISFNDVAVPGMSFDCHMQYPYVFETNTQITPEKIDTVNGKVIDILPSDPEYLKLLSYYIYDIPANKCYETNTDPDSPVVINASVDLIKKHGWVFNRESVYGKSLRGFHPSRDTIIGNSKFSTWEDRTVSDKPINKGPYVKERLFKQVIVLDKSIDNPYLNVSKEMAAKNIGWPFILDVYIKYIDKDGNEAAPIKTSLVMKYLGPLKKEDKTLIDKFTSLLKRN